MAYFLQTLEFFPISYYSSGVRSFALREWKKQKLTEKGLLFEKLRCTAKIFLLNRLNSISFYCKKDSGDEQKKERNNDTQRAEKRNSHSKLVRIYIFESTFPPKVMYTLSFLSNFIISQADRFQIFFEAIVEKTSSVCSILPKSSKQTF